MNMQLYELKQSEDFKWMAPARTIPESHKAVADLFQELAEHGRFDEQGGELSDEGWADSQ